MKALLSRNSFTYLLICLMLLSSSALQARSLPDFTALVEENSASVVNISPATEAAF